MAELIAMDLHELAIDRARRILGSSDTEDPDNVRVAQELLKEAERLEPAPPETSQPVQLTPSSKAKV